MKNRFIEAGRINNTHGITGELRMELWLDDPGLVRRAERIFIDGIPRGILSLRRHGRFYIVRLEGLNDPEAAAQLKGKDFFLAREDAQLPPGVYFLQDLLGARVQREDGSPVGVLEEILDRPASPVYVVRDDTGTEHLIPAVPAFILNADAETGVVTVRLIEGM